MLREIQSHLHLVLGGGKARRVLDRTANVTLGAWMNGVMHSDEAISFILALGPRDMKRLWECSEAVRSYQT